MGLFNFIVSLVVFVFIVNVVFVLYFKLEIRKVLTKLSKEKGFETIAEWIKPCENHLHWSATSTHDGNGIVIWAKFKAFMSHIVNKHADLDDPVFNKCAHGKIGPKKWLIPGMIKSCPYRYISTIRKLVFAWPIHVTMRQNQ